MTAAAEDSIAVIGMACRVPGAADVDTFWHNQLAGVDAVRRYTAAELRASGLDEETSTDPHYVAAYGHLDGLAEFDAGFFGYTAEEAARIDPQQRLFLEVATTALADAGHDPAARRETVGVYAGAAASRYFLFHVLPSLPPTEWEDAIPGNPPDFVPARVAYKLGLTGPAVAVQTACSSSLVAICQAAQGLLDYRCDLAIAGGAAVISTQQNGYRYRQGGPLSPDGVCRAFDAKASGMVFGNGAGAVVLKRLPDALADGDHVDAVLPGWAVNNDGAARAGFTAPGMDGQSAVVTEALACAQADPDSIGLVEAHGSATAVGDAIEFGALCQAFRTDARRFCALGSAKTAIGNLDAAAGVVGLIKAVCAVREGRIPPLLHFASPNPEIDLETGPFYVNQDALPWPERHPVRRAGVSSFGLGGTNAHVLVEHRAGEHSPRPRRPLPRFRRERHWIEPMDPRAKREAG
ncbi:beta-ketoacyl [acyl carrier protein] synthase domain-containing protein [Amycolatopsis aidingensis]|uniref:beta-ketoacyl [acyl carrier protein] synthase domain-containing protein n=1 Tax=Amycolatopsis aidingensis TaxID=2842453 RepID=UPI001C0DE8F4|nr:polyketide synthase [Amycolatopsis aidingensis]